MGGCKLSRDQVKIGGSYRLSEIATLQAVSLSTQLGDELTTDMKAKIKKPIATATMCPDASNQ
jgi:hypothetical protein